MTIRSWWVCVGSLVLLVSSKNGRADPAAPTYPPTQAQLAPYLPPEPVPYQEGWPVPPGYHVESRSRKGLVWSGAAVFAAGYSLPLLIATGKNPAAGWLLVPFAGPQLFASHQECPEPCDDPGTPVFMMVFTATQVTGAALFAAGLLAQKRWVVPNALEASVGGARVTVLPQVDRGGAGLLAAGTF